MTTPLTLTVTFSSDWHVGTGAGVPGSVDRIVARDADGLPYIPAKSLTGVWRDACERLCWALDDQGPPGRGWQAWVEALFGSQPNRATDDTSPPIRPALLSVRPAHLPADLRQVLKDGGEGGRRLRQALTFVKPGIALEAETGMARDDHLRFIEMARCGQSLVATVELSLAEGEARRTALALLSAAARLVEGIGHGRRRGNGACRLTFSALDSAAVSAWLETLAEPPPAPEPEDSPAWGPDDLEAVESASPDRSWSALDLVLTLETPVIAAEAVIGNVTTCRDSIPGALLLPALTRLLRAGGPDRGPLPDMERRVAGGTLRVLEATPEVAGRRGWPMPLAFSAPKEAETRPGLLPVGAINQLLDSPPRDTQHKGLKGWLAPVTTGAPPAGRRPRTLLATHNTVDDQAQRPMGQDQGGQGPGLFGHEALAAGQVFRSRLMIEGAGDLEAVRARLDGATLRLGRARKDDYGQVALKVEPLKVEPLADAPPPSPGPRGGETLSVWLLSPALLLDGQLNPDPTLDRLQAVLEQALGVGVALALERGHARTTRLESWHVGWGLPRPSLIGLAAGSCARFRVKAGAMSAAARARLEAAGIGERRAEGFGEISLDHPLLTRTLDAGADRPVDDGTPPPLALPAGEPSPQLRQLIATALRAEIDHSADQVVLKGNLLGLDGADLSASQLGRLREHINRLPGLDAPAEQQNAWLASLTASSAKEGSAKERGAWTEKKERRQTLDRLCRDPAAVWRELGAEAGDPLSLLHLTHPTLGEVLARGHWREAMRALYIAAIRRRMHAPAANRGEAA